MDTQNTSRKALNSSQEKEDQRLHRNTWDKVRRVAETAEQGPLGKWRERDCARHAAQNYQSSTTIAGKTWHALSVQDFSQDCCPCILEQILRRLVCWTSSVPAEPAGPVPTAVCYATTFEGKKKTNKKNSIFQYTYVLVHQTSHRSSAPSFCTGMLTLLTEVKANCILYTSKQAPRLASLHTVVLPCLPMAYMQKHVDGWK